MQLLDLKDSKEAVYGVLDAWVAWEQNFPIASLKRVLITLEHEQQWHRVIQVGESSLSFSLFVWMAHVHVSPPSYIPWKRQEEVCWNTGNCGRMKRKNLHLLFIYDFIGG